MKEDCRDCYICNRSYPIDEFMTSAGRVKSYCKCCHKLESHIAARCGGGQQGAESAKKWREFTRSLINSGSN